MAEVVTMPKLGFDMAEGTLVRWMILEGESVQKNAVLAEIETDKATVEVESAYEGVLLKHLVPEGEIVPVNIPIAIVAEPGEEVDISALIEQQPLGEKVEEQELKTAPDVETLSEEIEDGILTGRLPVSIKASPLARRIARDMNINLALVPGSGPGGRVTKKDIEAYLTSPAVPKAKAVAEKMTPSQKDILPPLTPMSVEPPPKDEHVPINRLRAAIGRRMTEVKQTVPHFYVSHEYDMKAVVDLRKEINTMLPEGEKLSVNDFIVKAVALALRQYPNLNASLQGDSFLVHGRVNVGVAVAVEGGLLTVVCKDTDRKSLRQISLEVRQMAARARDGKVKPDDIEGSTFSVSNLGMFDVENFIAIINPPEAGILAIGSAQDKPVVVGGEIVPGIRMKATISVDHRVSDGAEAARFLQSLAEYLEQPIKLLL